MSCAGSCVRTCGSVLAYCACGLRDTRFMTLCASCLMITRHAFHSAKRQGIDASMHGVPLQCNGGIGAGGTKCASNRCGPVHFPKNRVWLQWCWRREESVSTGLINHNCFVHARHRLFGQQTRTLSTRCTGFRANDPRDLHLSNWEFRVLSSLSSTSLEKKLYCPTHINLKYYCTYRKDVNAPKTLVILFDTILPLNLRWWNYVNILPHDIEVFMSNLISIFYIWPVCGERHSFAFELGFACLVCVVLNIICQKVY